MKLDVTDDSFDREVIVKSKSVPVLVDFWASWCGPCTFLKPVLEKLSSEFDGKFVLAKLSVEDNPDTASQFDIRSIPHVALFKDGRVVADFIGAKSESQVRDFLSKNL